MDGCVQGKKSSSKTAPTDLIRSQTASTSRSINLSSNCVNSGSNSIDSSSNSTNSRSTNRQEQVAPMTSVHTSTSSSRSGSSGDDDGISSSHSILGRNAENEEISPTTTQAFFSSLGTNFKILRPTDPVRELQTIIRDKNTSRSDFVFYADRLVKNPWINSFILLIN